MTLYLVAADTFQIRVQRTPLGPATPAGFVRGLWIDPEAPAGYPRCGWCTDGELWVDGRRWVMITRLGRWVNRDVYRESVPPAAAFEDQRVARYVREPGAQGRMLLDLYRAGWLDDSGQWCWGFYLDAGFVNDPPYAWDEEEYRLVTPDQLPEALRGYRLQTADRPDILLAVESGDPFADLPKPPHETPS